MSDHHVTLPSKPRIVEEKDHRGSYEIDGLHPGYGHTLGNSLRRIILSSLPGAAVVAVKIDGVSHEFSTQEGVKEDVITTLLNIKKIRFNLHTDEPQTVRLKVKGPKVATAADIEVTGQVEVLNPEQYIADVTGKKELDIEMTIERGLGYVSKEVLTKERVEIGGIALDAVFSPVRRVNYEVENMRVGDRTDFNRLRIFIETDGTMTPREALEKSIEIMIYQLKAVIGFKEEEIEVVEPTADDISGEEAATVAREEDDRPARIEDTEVLKTRMEELDLSPRVGQVLDEAGIRTLGGLARKREEDILTIPGMGQKGLQEIKRAISNYGITLRA